MSRPPYQTVIFDLDGTLAQSDPGIFECVTAALQRMGKPVPPPAILRKFIGPPLCVSFTQFCGMTAEEADQCTTYYRECYLQSGIYNNSLFPSILPLLQDLRTAGVQLAVATSKPQPMAAIVLEHLQIAPLLTAMAGASLDERKSDKAKLINTVLHQCNTTPDQAVMIGDTHFDAAGAKQAGTAFIGVLYGYGYREELTAHGATQFAAKPQALRPLLLPT